MGFITDDEVELDLLSSCCCGNLCRGLVGREYDLLSRRVAQELANDLPIGGYLEAGVDCLHVFEVPVTRRSGSCVRANRQPFPVGPAVLCPFSQYLCEQTDRRHEHDDSRSTVSFRQLGYETLLDPERSQGLPSATSHPELCAVRGLQVRNYIFNGGLLVRERLNGFAFLSLPGEEGSELLLGLRPRQTYGRRIEVGAG